MVLLSNNDMLIKTNIIFLDDSTGVCEGQTGAGGLFSQHVFT